jgi:TolB-like protein
VVIRRGSVSANTALSLWLSSGRSSLAFGLACLACLVMSSAASAQAKPKLALLPIVVHSAENPDYLRRGLSDMLASRFTQAGVFEVLRVDDMKYATTRIGEATEAGEALDADFVLFGSFTRFGNGASLDMQAAAADSSGEGAAIREIFVHSGSIGEVIPDLEDLVGKVTRMAVTDYQSPGGADPTTAGPAAASGPVSLEDLQRRVEALERALRAVQGGLPASQ